MLCVSNDLCVVTTGGCCRATGAMTLVYGIAEDELLFDFQLYENKLTLSQKARENSLRVPLIHFPIHNRATRYNLRSAQAFHQLVTSSFDVLQCAFKSNSECFAPKLLGPLQGPQVNQYLVDLYDFHTAGIVALHHGCPLAALKKHYTLSCLPIVNGTVALDSQQIGIEHHWAATDMNVLVSQQ